MHVHESTEHIRVVMTQNVNAGSCVSYIINASSCVSWTCFCRNLLNKVIISVLLCTKSILIVCSLMDYFNDVSTNFLHFKCMCVVVYGWVRKLLDLIKTIVSCVVVERLEGE